MKKVFTILIATMMLTAGMKVSIDRHYCRGQLAETKISFTAKPASCGMETQEHRNSNQLSFENKCCEDQVIYYSISNKFIPEQFKLTYPSARKDIPATPGLSLVFNLLDYHGFNTRVLSPGDGLRPGVSLSRICVFRT